MFKKKNINVAIFGMGYVGLPLALEFSKKFNVTGYDVNKINVNVRRESGLTPLMEAIRWKRRDVAMMLIGDKRYLSKKGMKVVHPRYLADVNAETNYFMTPLMFAASGEGNEELIKALLKAGANRGASDNKKRSAYDYAKAKGHNQYLRMLKP